MEVLTRCAVVVILLLGGHLPAAAQSQVESAIRFYAGGGAYCFRVAPLGTALSEETEWTMMVLTSSSNDKTSFKVREIDPGRTGLRGAALAAAGTAATSVWRSDRDREEFFQKFAEGIDAGALRARVVRAGPSNLAQLSSRERAELYLKFSDRGSVSFKDAPDLSSHDFVGYVEHFPD